MNPERWIESLKETIETLQVGFNVQLELLYLFANSPIILAINILSFTSVQFTTMFKT